MLRRALILAPALIALALLVSCSDGKLRGSPAEPTPINTTTPPDPASAGVNRYEGDLGGGVRLDMSVFLQLLTSGGSAVRTALHASATAVGTLVYQVTGSFTTTSGLTGTVQGRLDGTPESGIFTGTLRVSAACQEERKYSGPLTTAAINWVAGDFVQSCPTPSLPSTLLATASAAPPCTYLVSSANTSFPATGGQGTVTVTTDASCGWTVQSSADWVQTAGAPARSGSATVTYTVLANAGTDGRKATITVAGQQVSVSQSGTSTNACVPQLSTNSLTIIAAGEDRTVTVSIGAGCSWRVEGLPTWLTLSGSADRKGSGTVTLTAAPNTATSERRATFTIASLEVTATQAGVNPCVPQLSTTTLTIIAAGEVRTVTVSIGAACDWRVEGLPTWLTLSGSADRKGNGTVTLTAAPNTATSERRATFTIAGIEVTATQAGVSPCTYTVSPTAISVGAAGGTQTVSVTTDATCTWTAESQVNWVSVTQGATGKGNGTVTLNVQPSQESAARQGKVVIAGRTVTLTQDTPFPNRHTLHIELVGSGDGEVIFNLPFPDSACKGPAGTVCDAFYFQSVEGTPVPLTTPSPGFVAWELPPSCGNSRDCVLTPPPPPETTTVRVRFVAQSLVSVLVKTAAGYTPAPALTLSVPGQTPSLCNIDPNSEVDTQQTCQVSLYAPQSTVVTLDARHNTGASICWTGCVPNTANHFEQCPLTVSPGASPNVTLQLGFADAQLPPECQGTAPGVRGASKPR